MTIEEKIVKICQDNGIAYTKSLKEDILCFAHTLCENQKKECANSISLHSAAIFNRVFDTKNVCDE